MQSIGDDIYQYDNYIQTLREGFEKDLNDLPIHLPRISDRYHEIFKMHPDLEALFKSACYIANCYENHVNPGTILEEYPPEYIDNLNQNWKASIQTLQLFSEALRDTTRKSHPAEYWLKTEQIESLIKDGQEFSIFMALLREKSRTFDNNGPITFNSVKEKTEPIDSFTTITFKDTVTMTLDSILDLVDVSQASVREIFYKPSRKDEQIGCHDSRQRI